MKSFTIFVLGQFKSGKTSFVRSLDEREEGPLPLNMSYVDDFGRIVISDELVLYIAAWPGHSDLIRVLAPSIFEGLDDIRHVFERFSQVDLSGTAVIFIIDSTDPEAYAQNKYRLQELRYLHQKNPFVYVVAFSRQDMSEARTPEEMRDILSIPDDVKVMGYSVKESVTTKQVVLALIELFPRNEVVTQMIDALKARINDS